MVFFEIVVISSFCRERWNLFEMCFKILDQVHVLESCLCSTLVYVLEIDECDLIVFCLVIGIALPLIGMLLHQIIHME